LLNTLRCKLIYQYCPHMVKRHKRQCNQKWFIYSFRITASWRTFLSRSHSCISTNEKVSNFKKYLKTPFYQYFKIFNRPLLTTYFLVFMSFYHMRAEYCVFYLKCALLLFKICPLTLNVYFFFYIDGVILKSIASRYLNFIRIGFFFCLAYWALNFSVKCIYYLKWFLSWFFRNLSEEMV